MVCGAYFIALPPSPPPPPPPSLRAVKHNGNITMDQVIEISKIMRERSMSRYLSGTVKEILGTCQSVGCTVDDAHPHDKIDAIKEGTLAIPVSVLLWEVFSCSTTSDLWYYSISFMLLFGSVLLLEVSSCRTGRVFVLVRFFLVYYNYIG